MLRAPRLVGGDLTYRREDDTTIFDLELPAHLGATVPAKAAC